MARAASGRPPAQDGSRRAHAYTDRVLEAVRPHIVTRVMELEQAGADVLDVEHLAGLLLADLPKAPPALDPHYADVGPFYDSAGALRQLGGGTKQALDSRRRNQTVMAMQTGDGTWLYPAWQFTGHAAIHPALVPVLKALRGLDRWAAGVWLVTDHPDLDGCSPRRALADGIDPLAVAELAARDKQHLTGTDENWSKGA